MARADCKSIVRSSISFFTTSLRRDREAQLKKTATANQASAWSKPERGPIFVATRTRIKVAVIRTLPEMVMSASETTGYCSRQRVQTVAHAVKLLGFAQNRNRRHRAPDSRENHKEKRLQMGRLSSERTWRSKKRCLLKCFRTSVQPLLEWA